MPYIKAQDGTSLLRSDMPADSFARLRRLDPFSNAATFTGRRCLGEHFLLRGASVRVQRTVITFASVVAGAFGAVLGLVSGVWLAGGHLTIADVLEGRGIPFILATTVIALSSSFIFHWLSRVQSRRSRHSRPLIHQFLPAASLWSMTTKMLPKALPYSLG